MDDELVAALEKEIISIVVYCHGKILSRIELQSDFDKNHRLREKHTNENVS
jgi:hypothetical protein